MKKTLRIAVFLMAAVMALLLFSCKKDDGETVISYGEISVSEKLFIYELSRYKTELLANFGVTGTDVPEYWKTVIGTGKDGKEITVDNLHYEECLLNLRTIVYFANYAKQNGFNVTEEQHKALDEQMDKIVAQFGSKAKVDVYLEEYGIDYDLYREYLELCQLYTNGVYLAYSNGGERYITYDEEYEYYKNNYFTVKHVSVGTEIAGTDQQGNYIYFTDEEKKVQQEKITNIRNRIASGEDFNEIYLESEDKLFETYPNGYTITKGALTGDKAGYEEVALGLEMGEVAEWEMEGFGHYFIKRVELIEDDFQYCREYIYPILQEQDKMLAITEKADGFVEADEIIASYNLGSVPVMK